MGLGSESEIRDWGSGNKTYSGSQVQCQKGTGSRIRIRNTERQSSRWYYKWSKWP